ncbi:MAG: hypothetical protein OHK0019_00090 [Saprospiraceae bacterium]
MNASARIVATFQPTTQCGERVILQSGEIWDGTLTKSGDFVFYAPDKTGWLRKVILKDTPLAYIKPFKNK